MIVFLVSGRHKNSQDVPEQKRHARKQRKRSRDVLRRMILVQNVRRAVNNRRRRESDHNEREQTAETKAEQKTRGNKSESDETADRQNRT